MRDKVLHSVFAFTFCLMIGCAVATVLCFATDKEQLADLQQNQVDIAFVTIAGFLSTINNIETIVHFSLVAGKRG